MKTVRLLKDCAPYKKGSIMEMYADRADDAIASGIAEIVTDEVADVKAEEVSTDADRADDKVKKTSKK